ncbi:MAG: YaiO family outer membrane beta-barrel protein [Pseudomonadota bacterium]
MMIDVSAAAPDAPQPSIASPAPQAPAAGFDEQFQQARALVAAGQHDMAIALYTTLLARSPGNADVLLGRGLAQARLQRYPQAEADLRAATVASPAYADAWSALGNVYSWSDRPALAVPAYTQLIALQPREPAHLIARAGAYRDLKQRDQARVDLDAAAALGGDRERIAAISASLTAAPIATLALSPPPPRAPAPEVSVPLGYAWSAGLSTGSSRVSLGDQRWNEQNFSIRRHFDKGSLGFETLRASRFDRSDTAWALDGYASLWSGAYANLRYQHGVSERLFPGKSWRAELFQSVGGGWELSASDDRLHFGDSRVDIYGFGIARYVGDFYIRLRHTNIVSEDSRSSGDRLSVRYYYRGDGDNYAEFSASRGRSEDALSLAAGRVQSGGASLSYVRYPSPRWGYKIGVNYSRETNGSERGLSGGLFFRW